MSKLSKADSKLKDYLDEAVLKINRIDFIELDPIQVPHSYSIIQDVEIAGFFSAIFAWGNRKTIINKAKELMNLMDNSPFEFIINHTESDRKPFLNFKHRTFQATDIIYFLDFLQRHYQNYISLETAFYRDKTIEYTQEIGLNNFYSYFFDAEYAPNRTRKHIACPAKKATCKRLNMFLRWMVREDENKVDLGLWKTIPMSELMIPLDVHVERYARQFGLLQRKQRDWNAVCELTQNLKKFDSKDPVKYDYALFGLGVEKADFFNHHF